jgi:zinc D-Ala-D-Ala dipeptidase
MKSYQYLPIFECGESLEAIPAEDFCLQTPHAYVSLGAPYGEQTSPFYLRQGVLIALKQAQISLQQHYPGWKILIFDAYRPVSVQQFMVNHTFATALAQRGLSRDDLTLEQEKLLWQEVYQLWAMPSLDPLTPPPHSTGAALDVTLVNQIGLVDMGSEIDELSPRSQPDYFATVASQSDHPQLQQQAKIAATHRHLLYTVMTGAGFQRHPGEWWHFSLGDQMWAWLNQQQGNPNAIARYGRVE